MTPAEGELINRISQQDIGAFDELYDRYKSMVFRYAFHLTQQKHEAEELFQETWLRIVQALPNTDITKSLKAWVMTIMKNLYRDHLRKKRIRRLYFMQDVKRDSDESARPDPAQHPRREMRYDESDRVDIGLAIKTAITSLPERQRQVFILKEIEGFKHSEIGDILGVPIGTVKSLLFRATRHLQDALTQYSPIVKEKKTRNHDAMPQS